jgi:C4-dicarboxylate-specific signal transduction histidine kinase
MSQTIDDFRNFFQHGGEETEFSVKEAVESVYNLVSNNLSYNHIQCLIEVRKDSVIQGGLNEFKQVLINILNNAQEAIQSNASVKKEINVLITRKNDNAVISIKDDGGGIAEDVLSKIFDPYFTTKNQTQGTGLGLYMSKQIIENSMCGSLYAINIKDGAEFTISIPTKKNIKSTKKSIESLNASGRAG